MERLEEIHKKDNRWNDRNPLFDYNIFLIGFMGVGKSTIAGELKDKLGMACVEMDEAIVQEQGMSIPDIFAEYGEAFFRSLETNMLIELQKCRQTIVSCGGGVATRAENVAHMKKSGRIVLLTAMPETVYERVKDQDSRPVLSGHMNTEYITALMEKRRADYESAADITVATDGKNAAQICEEIISRLLALTGDKTL